MGGEMVYILAQRLSGRPNFSNCERKKHPESKGLLSKTWKHLIGFLMCFQRVDFKTLDLSIFLCGDLSLGTHFCPASNLRQAQQIPSNKGQKVLCDVVGVLNFVISSGTKPAGGNSPKWWWLDKHSGLGITIVIFPHFLKKLAWWTPTHGKSDK